MINRFLCILFLILFGAFPEVLSQDTPGPESAAAEVPAASEKSKASRPKNVPPVVKSRKGAIFSDPKGRIKLTLANQRHGYGYGDRYDPDIASPKSVTFALDGSKFYVNSLEGCKTVVYDSKTLRKLKTIRHKFDSGKGPLWLAPSGLYKFAHYEDGESKPFLGKPVESALSPDGKYLFVPYYRRTFDINAQDPSALAVIDTSTDEIVLMMETGPLPKMVQVSNDGKTLAITHWGDNTVGLVDISSPDPHMWRHRKTVVVDHKLKLNYSLTNSVDRDSGSGYALRGTLFLPGDSILLVSGMGGNLAVIDPQKGEWLGWAPQLLSVRHISRGGNDIYFSRNSAGEVVSIPVDTIVNTISRRRHDDKRTFNFSGLRRCKVGGGARTIELSPSGKFLFAACNTASALYVVDTETMTVIGSTPVDSYPVGLDVSPDGSMVVVTSQGRKGYGGNAVNIFDVTYAVPEHGPVVKPISSPEYAEVAIDSVPAELPAAGKLKHILNSTPAVLAYSAVGILLAAAVIALLFRNRKV